MLVVNGRKKKIPAHLGKRGSIQKKKKGAAKDKMSKKTGAKAGKHLTSFQAIAKQNLDAVDCDDGGGASSDTSAEWFDGGDDSDSKAYGPGGYLRVRIGDLLGDRYLVESKLGWGHFSTVWLASDQFSMASDRFVALKIQKSAPHYTEAAQDEIELLRAAAQKATDEFSNHVVQMHDSFMVQGPHGKHVVFVFEVLGQNLLDLIKAYNYRGLPLAVVKKIARGVLIGLDYLHRKCSVIHTDLKPENVLLTRTKPVDLVALERDKCTAYIKQYSRQLKRCQSQLSDLTLAKVRRKRLRLQASELKLKLEEMQAIADGSSGLLADGIREETKQSGASDSMVAVDSTTSSSLPVAVSSGDSDGSALKGQFEYIHGWDVVKQCPHSSASLPLEPLVKIADLGNACWTDKHFTDDITTRQYRAPESILGQVYSGAVDIWSHACMIFELVTGDYLFDPREDVKKRFSRDEDHIALISELSGEFPFEMTQSGKFHSTFFDSKGKLRHIKKLDFWPLYEVLREKYRLARSESRLLGDFLARMLTVEPSKRATALEMLEHPWLTVSDKDKRQCYESECRWLRYAGKPVRDTNALLSDEEHADASEDEAGGEVTASSGVGAVDAAADESPSLDALEADSDEELDEGLFSPGTFAMGNFRSHSAPPPTWHRYTGIEWYEQFEEIVEDESEDSLAERIKEIVISRQKAQASATAKEPAVDGSLDFVEGRHARSCSFASATSTGTMASILDLD